MYYILLIAFILVPVIELTLLVRIGQLVGPIPTALLIVIMGVIGAYQARKSGLRTIQEIRRAIGEGRVPGNEVIDRLLILIAGLLLITPGVLTDLIGFAFLVPSVRTVARELAKIKLLQLASKGNVKYRIHWK